MRDPPYPAGLTLTPRVRSAAAEVFAGQGVQFAYLFGSHARGQAREGSDVDVAVYFGDDVASSEYLERATSLSGRLAYRASAGPINGLVVLNEASLRLRALPEWLREEVADLRRLARYDVETLLFSISENAYPMIRFGGRSTFRSRSA